METSVVSLVDAGLASHHQVRDSAPPSCIGIHGMATTTIQQFLAGGGHFERMPVSLSYTVLQRYQYLSSTIVHTCNVTHVEKETTCYYSGLQHKTRALNRTSRSLSSSAKQSWYHT